MNRLFFQAVMGLAFLLDKNSGGDGTGGGGDGTGGGGGNGTGQKAGGAGSGDDQGGGTADLAKQIEAMAAMNKQLLERLTKLEGGHKPPEDKGDLSESARLAREKADAEKAHTTKLQDAMRFTMGAAQWQKDFAPFVPETVAAIFAAAEKENYGTEIEKANAIKAGVIQEFFSQQANLDLLTTAQKNSLESFKKLTKDLKAERANEVWEMVLEPTLEGMKRTRRAELVSKGLGDPSDKENAYVTKMREHSRKHYLGVKNA